MQLAGRWMALVLAGLYVVGGCGGDQSIEFGTGGTAFAGGAAGAHHDSGPSGNGGTGGSTTSPPDSSVDAASDGSVATPDVSTGDASEEARDARAADASTESAADATTEVSSDASGEANGPSDDAIADATDDGPPVSKICAKGCVTSADCSPSTTVYKPVCDPTRDRCVSCVDDVPCFGGASGWTRPCTTDSACTPTFGDYCVDIGGSGFCAFDSAKIATSTCSGNASTYTIKKYRGATDGGSADSGSETGGGIETVSVCAKLTTTCDLLRGRCEGPCTITCTGDGSVCTSTCNVTRGGKICDAITRRCGCASDDDCGPPSSHCNLVTSQCECASGNDCSPDGGGSLVCK